MIFSLQFFIDSTPFGIELKWKNSINTIILQTDVRIIPFILAN
jgi:hypothetical protein